MAQVSTPQKITFRTLWKRLTPSERKEAAEAFLSNKSKNARSSIPRVLARLAIAKGFRPEFLAKRSREDLVDYIASSMLHQTLAKNIDDVLQEYILKRCGKMIVTALDSVGIKHIEGLIDDDRDVCPREDLVKGYRAIQGQYSSSDRILYYGFLLARSNTQYFSETPAAMEEVGYFEILEGKPDKNESAATDSVEQQDAGDAEQERSDKFVTLDTLLIKTVVSSTMGVAGAFDTDQCEELIEEVIALNIETRHRFFHRGYAHALFGRTPDFDFEGSNEERRCWYMTGILMGLIRKAQDAVCLKLIDQHSRIFDAVCERRDLHCGRMLVSPLFRILCDGSQYARIKKLVAHHIDFLAPPKRRGFMISLLDEGKSLILAGKPSEALLILSSIDEDADCKDLEPAFVEWLMPQIHRRIGQAHQLQGNFAEAKERLTRALETERFPGRWNAEPDLGLIQGGFRSLFDTLPSGDAAHDQSIRDALEANRTCFVSAIDKYGPDATNAHFILGLLEFLTPDPTTKISDSGADCFQRSLTGMLEQPEAYGENRLIIWTKFCLGICLLETGRQSHFQRASDYALQALKSPTNFPLSIWERCCTAAALYEDDDLAGQIAEFLLRNRGKKAYPLLKESDLLRGDRKMRVRYREWIEGEEVPSKERWDELVQLLNFAMADRSIDEAADILDSLQKQAEGDRALFGDLADLLEDSRNYDPAWSSEDAENARLHLFELDGRIDELKGILESRFFLKRNSQSPQGDEEALQIIDWLRDIGTDGEDLSRLQNSIPQPAAAESQEVEDAESRLRTGVPVRIIAIGGNEVQKRMEEAILANLAIYPGLSLQFYYTGWTSNWNVHLDRVLGMMEGVDAIVLSVLVRTTFGKKLREQCNGIAPWFPSTGKGRGSIERSIVAAAKWVAMESK